MTTSRSEERAYARWYETFLDVVKAAHRRDYGIAVHPDHKSPIQDMMERVLEDELYPYQDLPPLVVHMNVPRGEYRMVDKESMRVLSFQAAMQSKKGLGRFSHLWTPDESKKKRH